MTAQKTGHQPAYFITCLLSLNASQRRPHKMYSRGKNEIEKERQKRRQITKAVKQFKPEDIIQSAIPLNKTLETTKRLIEETTLSLTKLKAQTESLKAIGDITTQFTAFNIEMQQIKDSQKELIGLLKAVLTESYRDAETQKHIEALLI